MIALALSLTLLSSQGQPLPPVYAEGPNLLPLPAWTLKDRSTRFVGRNGSEPFIRRIHDIDAEGVSDDSCADALEKALFALHKASDRYGALGVAAVRSPDLDAVEGGRKYVCEQSGPRMTVRLTGVAAGLPL